MVGYPKNNSLQDHATLSVNNSRLLLSAKVLFGTSTRNETSKLSRNENGYDNGYWIKVITNVRFKKMAFT